MGLICKPGRAVKTHLEKTDIFAAGRENCLPLNLKITFYYRDLLQRNAMEDSLLDYNTVWMRYAAQQAFFVLRCAYKKKAYFSCIIVYFQIYLFIYSKLLRQTFLKYVYKVSKYIELLFIIVYNRFGYIFARDILDKW
jgi:hypothetical protein